MSPRAKRGQRHKRFRNRCVALLEHESRWMTASEIVSAFEDGHPATLTHNGMVSHQRYIPTVASGQLTQILKWDKRLEHRKTPRTKTEGCMINRKNSLLPKHMITEWRVKHDNDSEVR